LSPQEIVVNENLHLAAQELHIPSEFNSTEYRSISTSRYFHIILYTASQYTAALPAYRTIGIPTPVGLL